MNALPRLVGGIHGTLKLVRRKPLKHATLAPFWSAKVATMTTCVADICGGHKAIILCADKQLDLGHVYNNIGVKITTLHRNWKLMFAGRDIQPVFDIVDRAKQKLRVSSDKTITNPTTSQVKNAVTDAWRDELTIRTEIKVLGKRKGWTLERLFNEGKDHFLPSDLATLIEAVEREQFDLEVIVAGFNEEGCPEIMSGGGHTDGVLSRDIGYAAIGNGAPNALTYFGWREANPETPIRGALAHSIEAKLSGELATANSEETDVYIMRFEMEDIVLPAAIIENVLMQKIAIPNRPGRIKMGQLELLNDITELGDIPFVWADEKYRLIELPFDDTDKPQRPKEMQRRGVTTAQMESGATIIPQSEPKRRRRVKE